MHDASPIDEDHKAASRQAIEEHRRLQKTLLGLEAVQPFEELLGRLDTLRDQLDEHFAIEEGEDGVLAVVEGRSVHLHTKIAALRDEHVRLRAELHDLRARARRCLAGEQPAVRAAVADFKHRLSDHESEETDVFMESWNTDLGAQD